MEKIDVDNDKNVDRLAFLTKKEGKVKLNWVNLDDLNSKTESLELKFEADTLHQVEGANLIVVGGCGGKIQVYESSIMRFLYELTIGDENACVNGLKTLSKN